MLNFARPQRDRGSNFDNVRPIFGRSLICENNIEVSLGVAKVYSSDAYSEHKILRRVCNNFRVSWVIIVYSGLGRDNDVFLESVDGEI